MVQFSHRLFYVFSIGTQTTPSGLQQRNRISPNNTQLQLAQQITAHRNVHFVWWECAKDDDDNFFYFLVVFCNTRTLEWWIRRLKQSESKIITGLCSQLNSWVVGAKEINRWESRFDHFSLRFVRNVVASKIRATQSSWHWIYSFQSNGNY